MSWNRFSSQGKEKVLGSPETSIRGRRTTLSHIFVNWMRIQDPVLIKAALLKRFANVLDRNALLSI